MPVRVRITLLFSLMVSVILMLLCLSVYYFSYLSRLNNFKTRLTNRAITTSRLLGQSSIFNNQLIRKIDSATAVAMKEKTIQVYDYLDNLVYWYCDSISDTIHVKPEILDEARLENNIYRRVGKRDMIVHHYVDDNTRVVVVAAAYDENGKNNLRQLRVILWLSFAGGILGALISGYIFSGRLLDPIREITNKVNEISAKNLTTRIKTGTIKDEWHYLAETLNKLLDRLQESFELQQRFISNASHELSTPLTAISSQLEVTLQRDRQPHEYRQTMQSVYQDVLNLNHLTRTLLEFAKASGSPGGLPIELIRVDEVLLELPAWIKKVNINYNLFMSFDALPSEEEKLLVAGNKDLLQTAVKNVVINACKYSDNHQAIVRLSVSGDQIIIKVEDEGKGLDEAEWEKIFQPFYRTEDTRYKPGFGLGLSLSNRMIKLHKGHIDVNSVLGKGTIFTIRLPIAAQRKEIN
jgi:two-component system, OmpR family, sensor histidine kinase ArlS